MRNRVRSWLERLAWGSVVVLVLIVLPACRPAAAQPPRSSTTLARNYPTPEHPLNLPGQFVFSPGDGSVWLQAANGADIHVLVKRSEDNLAEAPAFSPDGRQVLYSSKSFTSNGEMIEDVRVIGVDGSGERVVAAPQDTKTAFILPSWSSDGKQLFFASSPTTPGNQQDHLMRASASGGTPQLFMENARGPNFSRDGKKMVFTRYDYGTYRSSLWVAQADGSNPKMLMDDHVFISIEGPRFSPDGQTIVFAASGAPQRELPGLQSSGPGMPPYAQSPLVPDDSCLVRLPFGCWMGAASAHGLPWDLWLVNTDGTKFDRLTKIGADSPYPVWSADGKYVAFMDFSGMYVVERQSKTGYLISMNGGHGSLDWH